MTWVVVFAVGLGSFMFRLGPLLVLQRRPLSESGDRLIRHAGAAAITALITLSTTHSASGGHLIPTALAMAVAVALAARQASMIRLVLCGGSIYAGALIVLALLSR
jgi:branched-subunit amino acid transport protein